MRQTDGQFVNGCSDALSRPTPTGCASWSSPGRSSAAVRRCRCAAHGELPGLAQRQRTKGPRDLKIPVLLLGVQNDPIIGNEGVAAVAATIINAGATSRRVIWQGIGHGATIYNSCALPPVLGYLDTGKLPETVRSARLNGARRAAVYGAQVAPTDII